MISAILFNFLLFIAAMAQYYDDSADVEADQSPSSHQIAEHNFSVSGSYKYSAELLPVQPVYRQQSTRSNECGKGAFAITRVVGGAPASLGDFPWAAAIYVDNRFICGGTLVNHDYILTAGHCTVSATNGGKQIPTKLFSIRLGDLKTGKKASAKSKTFNLKNVITHPNFELRNFHNDIAVLQLEKSVEFNDNIYPACLPLKSEENFTFVHTGAILAGWGTVGFEKEPSDHLLYVPLPIQPLDVCEKAYKIFSKTHPIIPSQLCSGVLTGRRDGCQGDSGGPLTIMDPNLKDSPWTLVGIVSYGHKCAEPGFPGIYTRVTSFLDWIEKNII